MPSVLILYTLNLSPNLRASPKVGHIPDIDYVISFVTLTIYFQLFKKKGHIVVSAPPFALLLTNLYLLFSYAGAYGSDQFPSCSLAAGVRIPLSLSFSLLSRNFREHVCDVMSYEPCLLILIRIYAYAYTISSTLRITIKTFES